MSSESFPVLFGISADGAEEDWSNDFFVNESADVTNGYISRRKSIDAGNDDDSRSIQGLNQSLSALNNFRSASSGFDLRKSTLSSKESKKSLETNDTASGISSEEYDWDAEFGVDDDVEVSQRSRAQGFRHLICDTTLILDQEYNQLSSVSQGNSKIPPGTKPGLDNSMSNLPLRSCIMSQLLDGHFDMNIQIVRYPVPSELYSIKLNNNRKQMNARELEEWLRNIPQQQKVQQAHIQQICEKLANLSNSIGLIPDSLTSTNKALSGFSTNRKENISWFGSFLHRKEAPELSVANTKAWSDAIFSGWTGRAPYFPVLVQKFIHLLDTWVKCVSLGSASSVMGEGSAKRHSFMTTTSALSAGTTKNSVNYQPDFKSASEIPGAKVEIEDVYGENFEQRQVMFHHFVQILTVIAVADCEGAIDLKGKRQRNRFKFVLTRNAQGNLCRDNTVFGLNSVTSPIHRSSNKNRHLFSDLIRSVATLFPEMVFESSLALFELRVTAHFLVQILEVPAPAHDEEDYLSDTQTTEEWKKGNSFSGSGSTGAGTPMIRRINSNRSIRQKMPFTILRHYVNLYKYLRNFREAPDPNSNNSSDSSHSRMSIISSADERESCIHIEAMVIADIFLYTNGIDPLAFVWKSALMDSLKRADTSDSSNEDIYLDEGEEGDDEDIDVIEVEADDDDDEDDNNEADESNRTPDTRFFRDIEGNDTDGDNSVSLETDNNDRGFSTPPETPLSPSQRLKRRHSNSPFSSANSSEQPRSQTNRLPFNNADTLATNSQKSNPRGDRVGTVAGSEAEPETTEDEATSIPISVYSEISNRSDAELMMQLSSSMTLAALMDDIPTTDGEEMRGGDGNIPSFLRSERSQSSSNPRPPSVQFKLSETGGKPSQPSRPQAMRRASSESTNDLPVDRFHTARELQDHEIFSYSMDLRPTLDYSFMNCETPKSVRRHRHRRQSNTSSGPPTPFYSSIVEEVLCQTEPQFDERFVVAVLRSGTRSLADLTLPLYASIGIRSLAKASVALVLAIMFSYVESQGTIAESLFFEGLFLLESLSYTEPMLFDVQIPILSSLGVLGLEKFAEILFENSKYKFGLVCLESASAVCHSLSIKDERRILRRLSLVSKENRDISRALLYHSRILQTAQLEGKLSEFVYIAGIVSRLFLDAGEIELAVKVLRVTASLLAGVSIDCIRFEELNLRDLRFHILPGNGLLLPICDPSMNFEANTRGILFGLSPSSSFTKISSQQKSDLTKNQSKLASWQKIRFHVDSAACDSQQMLAILSLIDALMTSSQYETAIDTCRHLLQRRITSKGRSSTLMKLAKCYLKLRKLTFCEVTLDRLIHEGEEFLTGCADPNRNRMASNSASSDSGVTSDSPNVRTRAHTRSMTTSGPSYPPAAMAGIVTKLRSEEYFVLRARCRLAANDPEWAVRWLNIALACNVHGMLTKRGKIHYLLGRAYTMSCLQCHRGGIVPVDLIKKESEFAESAEEHFRVSFRYFRTADDVIHQVKSVGRLIDLHLSRMFQQVVIYNIPIQKSVDGRGHIILEAINRFSRLHLELAGDIGSPFLLMSGLVYHAEIAMILKKYQLAESAWYEAKLLMQNVYLQPFVISQLIVKLSELSADYDHTEHPHPEAHHEQTLLNDDQIFTKIPREKDTHSDPNFQFSSNYDKSRMRWIHTPGLIYRLHGMLCRLVRLAAVLRPCPPSNQMTELLSLWSRMDLIITEMNTQIQHTDGEVISVTSGHKAPVSGSEPSEGDHSDPAFFGLNVDSADRISAGELAAPHLKSTGVKSTLRRLIRLGSSAMTFQNVFRSPHSHPLVSNSSSDSSITHNEDSEANRNNRNYTYGPSIPEQTLNELNRPTIPSHKRRAKRLDQTVLLSMFSKSMLHTELIGLVQYTLARRSITESSILPPQSPRHQMNVSMGDMSMLHNPWKAQTYPGGVTERLSSLRHTVNLSNFSQPDLKSPAVREMIEDMVALMAPFEVIRRALKLEYGSHTVKENGVHAVGLLLSEFQSLAREAFSHPLSQTAKAISARAQQPLSKNLYMTASGWIVDGVASYEEAEKAVKPPPTVSATTSRSPSPFHPSRVRDHDETLSPETQSTLWRTDSPDSKDSPSKSGTHPKSSIGESNKPLHGLVHRAGNSTMEYIHRTGDVARSLASSMMSAGQNMKLTGRRDRDMVNNSDKNRKNDAEQRLSNASSSTATSIFDEKNPKPIDMDQSGSLIGLAAGADVDGRETSIRQSRCHALFLRLRLYSKLYVDSRISLSELLSNNIKTLQQLLSVNRRPSSLYNIARATSFPSKLSHLYGNTDNFTTIPARKRNSDALESDVANANVISSTTASNVLVESLRAGFAVSSNATSSNKSLGFEGNSRPNRDKHNLNPSRYPFGNKYVVLLDHIALLYQSHSKPDGDSYADGRYVVIDPMLNRLSLSSKTTPRRDSRTSEELKNSSSSEHIYRISSHMIQRQESPGNSESESISQSNSEVIATITERHHSEQSTSSENVPPTLISDEISINELNDMKNDLSDLERNSIEFTTKWEYKNSIVYVSKPCGLSEPPSLSTSPYSKIFFSKEHHLSIDLINQLIHKIPNILSYVENEAPVSSRPGKEESPTENYTNMATNQSFFSQIPKISNNAMDPPIPRVLFTTISKLIDIIGFKGLLFVINLLLLEQSVVFLIKPGQEPFLQDVVCAIIQTIHPFQWHHFLIPLLPVSCQDVLRELLDVSPGKPFLLGTYSSLLESMCDSAVHTEVRSELIPEGSTKNITLELLNRTTYINLTTGSVIPSKDADFAFHVILHLNPTGRRHLPQGASKTSAKDSVAPKPAKTEFARSRSPSFESLIQSAIPTSSGSAGSDKDLGGVESHTNKPTEKAIPPIPYRFLQEICDHYYLEFDSLNNSPWSTDSKDPNEDTMLPNIQAIAMLNDPLLSGAQLHTNSNDSSHSAQAPTGRISPIYLSSVSPSYTMPSVSNSNSPLNVQGASSGLRASNRVIVEETRFRRGRFINSQINNMLISLLSSIPLFLNRTRSFSITSNEPTMEAFASASEEHFQTPKDREDMDEQLYEFDEIEYMEFAKSDCKPFLKLLTKTQSFKAHLKQCGKWLAAHENDSSSSISNSSSHLEMSECSKCSHSRCTNLFCMFMGSCRAKMEELHQWFRYSNSTYYEGYLDVYSIRALPEDEESLALMKGKFPYLIESESAPRRPSFTSALARMSLPYTTASKALGSASSTPPGIPPRYPHDTHHTVLETPRADLPVDKSSGLLVIFPPKRRYCTIDTNPNRSILTIFHSSDRTKIKSQVLLNPDSSRLLSPISPQLREEERQRQYIGIYQISEIEDIDIKLSLTRWNSDNEEGTSSSDSFGVVSKSILGDQIIILRTDLRSENEQWITGIRSRLLKKKYEQKFNLLYGAKSSSSSGHSTPTRSGLYKTSRQLYNSLSSSPQQQII